MISDTAAPSTALRRIAARARHPHRSAGPTHGVLLGLMALALCSAPAAGEAPVATLDTGGHEWLAAGDGFEVVLDRWPTATEGSLAVLVGGGDRTDLFRRTAHGLAYRPELAKLPRGESEIAVFLVTPTGEWRELARLPLRVRHRGGIETATWTARGVFTGVEPVDSAPAGEAGGIPPRSWTLQLAGDAEATRSGWRLKPSVQLLGASEEAQRLSFATAGEAAPVVDLAAYGVELAHRSGFVLALGNLTVSRQRLLADGFPARGLRLEAPLGRRVNVAVAATAGSLAVGFDELLGLDRPDHRIVSGTLGAELLPRAGGLRLEGSWLDGKVAPRDSFNRGFVVDAEESRGWGLRLQATTAGQRLRFEAGWASARFATRPDAQLEAGLPVVETPAETRQARYATLDLDLLRRPLARGGLASLALSLRHQRVDPLYRVVGLFVQADHEEDAAELRLGLGPLLATAVFNAAADNLDDIATLVETRNRRWGLSLALPLAQVWPAPDGSPAASAWLPTVSWALDRNHQYGLGVPPGTDLRPDQIPDQLADLQNLGLDWQLARWHLGYRLTLSTQDNRQPGRERADFSNRAQSLSLGGPLGQRFDLGLDLGHDRLASREQQRVDTTDRVGLNFNWRLPRSFTAAGSIGKSRQYDDLGSRASDAQDGNLQITWGVPEWRRGSHGGGGQLYLRYGRQAASSVDRTFALASDSTRWTLTGGVSLSLF